MAGRIGNPFVLTGYVSPEYFCDRKAETEKILDCFHNGQNVTLTSPRRMGKTGLIHHVFRTIESLYPERKTIYIDISPTESLSDFAKVFASSVLSQMDSDPMKAMKKILKRIQDGSFADRWISENQTGRCFFNSKRDALTAECRSCLEARIATTGCRLVVDRGAYDKILQAGGFISVNTGGVPDANAIPIPKKNADESMDAAACVGCGACAATCKNGSAMLFVAARVSSLALLPQGKVEGARRAKAMVEKMDELGFGACTNTRACEMECPKHITVSHIARLNREFLKAKFKD